MHSAAYNFENLIFLFIGIGVFGFNLPYRFGLILFKLIKKRKLGLISFAIIFFTLNFARFINISLNSFLLNLTRKHNRIDFNYQFLMWFSGFRGAMGKFYFISINLINYKAFALALNSIKKFQKGNVGDLMLTITIIDILINV